MLVLAYFLFLLLFSVHSCICSDTGILKWFLQIVSWNFVLSNNVHYVKIDCGFTCMPSQWRQKSPIQLIFGLLLFNMTHTSIIFLPLYSLLKDCNHGLPIIVFSVKLFLQPVLTEPNCVCNVAALKQMAPISPGKLCLQKKKRKPESNFTLNF